MARNPRVGKKVAGMSPLAKKQFMKAPAKKAVKKSNPATIQEQEQEAVIKQAKQINRKQMAAFKAGRPTSPGWRPPHGMKRPKKLKTKAKPPAWTPPPKPADRAPGWQPPPMADKVLNPTATIPKLELSPAFQRIWDSGDSREVLVVKAPEGSVTNKAEFVTEMARLNFKVVFLEFHKMSVTAPVIERQVRSKAE